MENLRTEGAFRFTQVRKQGKIYIVDTRLVSEPYFVIPIYETYVARVDKEGLRIGPSYVRTGNTEEAAIIIHANATRIVTGNENLRFSLRNCGFISSKSEEIC